VLPPEPLSAPGRHLIRRPAETSRSETFELSPAALATTRFLDQLAIPRQAATKSRLANIAAQLQRLAEDIPTDFARVRTEFESLNRELRTKVLESDAAQRAVLDDIFRFRGRGLWMRCAMLSMSSPQIFETNYEYLK